MARTIDIDALIDRQPVGRFHIALLLWSFLIMLLDGYDITAAAFAGPELVRVWHVERGALGPVLSASLFGILFGSLIFGFVGDRWGRKPAIVGAGLVFGLFTTAAAFAGSLDQLAILRFLAGVGIGGALPNTIALNTEYAPKRVRSTLVILMFTGVTFGGSLPGVVATRLVPDYGWPALFLVGGLIPLVLSGLLLAVLPESIKFLALDPARAARTAQMVARLDPGQPAEPGDRFVSEGEQGEAFAIGQLFAGRFQVATPLLWLLFGVNLMVFYFINSWMPTLVTAAGAPVAQAALATSLFQVGGTVGGILLSRLLDRHGLKPVGVLFLAACPVVASIGYLATSETPLLVAAFAAGFCLLGLQFGLNASAGLIYPTRIRANGVGWALGVGRLGAVLGPLIGGTLIAMQLPIQKLYLFAALPLIVGTVACLCLIRVLGRAPASA